MVMRNLEERIDALEQQMSEVKAMLAQTVRPKDWRSTVGMFTGDEGMKRIDAEALKYREANRAKARRRSARKPRTKK